MCFAWLVLLPGQMIGQEDSTAGEVVASENSSPRNANYTIEVSLDPEGKILVGSQTVVWRNIQSAATDELWFHLYWNGWRNSRSTWMQEDQIRGRSSLDSEEEAEDWSYLEVDAVRLSATAEADEVDLQSVTSFASPDDGNPDDRTVMVVSLPTPVEPGESVSVELE